jgi:hypothetical protein
VICVVRCMKFGMRSIALRKGCVKFYATWHCIPLRYVFHALRAWRWKPPFMTVTVWRRKNRVHSECRSPGIPKLISISTHRHSGASAFRTWTVKNAFTVCFN